MSLLLKDRRKGVIEDIQVLFITTIRTGNRVRNIIKRIKWKGDEGLTQFRKRVIEEANK